MNNKDRLKWKENCFSTFEFKAEIKIRASYCKFMMIHPC